MVVGENRMKRKFNITGACNPQRHYMVRLEDRLKKIKEDFVDEGSYFVINKGRQKLSMAFRFIEAEDGKQLQKMLLDFRKDSPNGRLDGRKSE